MAHAGGGCRTGKARRSARSPRAQGTRRTRPAASAASRRARAGSRKISTDCGRPGRGDRVSAHTKRRCRGGRDHRWSDRGRRWLPQGSCGSGRDHGPGFRRMVRSLSRHDNGSHQARVGRGTAETTVETQPRGASRSTGRDRCGASLLRIRRLASESASGARGASPSLSAGREDAARARLRRPGDRVLQEHDQQKERDDDRDDDQHLLGQTTSVLLAPTASRVSGPWTCPAASRRRTSRSTRFPQAAVGWPRGRRCCCFSGGPSVPS